MENHKRQPAGPSGQVVGVVARVPFLGIVAVEDVEVRGVLGVDRLGQIGLAVDQRGAVEGREQPLVGIDDERVGPFEAGELGPGPRARTAPRRRRHRRCGTTASAPAATSATPARSSTMPALVVPAVATTAMTSSARGCASRAARSAAPVRRWSSVGTTSASTPMTCRALPTEEWASSLTAISGSGRSEPAAPVAGRVAGHHEGGEVPGRAAGHEAAAGPGREAGRARR